MENVWPLHPYLWNALERRFGPTSLWHKPREGATMHEGPVDGAGEISPCHILVFS